MNIKLAFTPVSNVATMSMLLVVHPKVEAKSLKEFVALAKAQPNKLNFGSPGIGTTGAPLVTMCSADAHSTGNMRRWRTASRRPS